MQNVRGYRPSTPSTNLFFGGLAEAIVMLEEEGLEAVFARRRRPRLAATRTAVVRWGLEVLCQDPARHSVVTAVMMPDAHDAVLASARSHSSSSICRSAWRFIQRGRIFRIGPIWLFNVLTLIGALAGVEMAFGLAGVPHERGGVQQPWITCARRPK
jgi:alanine-glyoxylate transaminase/serine-glyoxylate transaminase/serine-pyruvate transaminase